MEVQQRQLELEAAKAKKLERGLRAATRAVAQQQQQPASRYVESAAAAAQSRRFARRKSRPRPTMKSQWM